MAAQPESIDHLTEVGVKNAEAALDKPSVHDLDASELTVEKTKNPKDVPEVNSERVWKMRDCSDHSIYNPSQSRLLNISCFD